MTSPQEHASTCHTGKQAPAESTWRAIYRSALELTHNSAAVIGVLSASALILLSLRSDLRDSAEQHLLGWLQQRQDTEVVVFTQPTAIDRVTAVEPSDLPKGQANVAFWLSRKYRVAPEPLSALVAEAFALGQRLQLDPTLILAVMAVESRFNPFAQSAMGAQGLMQVMTRVHTDKYEGFGGQLAAFDPVSNLRVGVQVLQDCIKRAGSVEGGLRLYVGAVTTDGNDYINKVLAEHQRILNVSLGKPMTRFVPPAPAPSADSLLVQSKTPGDEPKTEVNTPAEVAPALTPTAS
jgi:hypothetical protein